MYIYNIYIRIYIYTYFCNIGAFTHFPFSTYDWEVHQVTHSLPWLGNAATSLDEASSVPIFP